MKGNMNSKKYLSKTMLNIKTVGNIKENKKSVLN